MTKTEMLEKVAAAAAAPFTSGRAMGCGRAYVCVHSVDKPTMRMFAAACKEVGLLFLPKAYGVTGPAVYVGYDNCDGRALARAEAVAASLTASGLPAYTEAVSD
jgi:hypothetical protein